MLYSCAACARNSRTRLFVITGVLCHGSTHENKKGKRTHKQRLGWEDGAGSSESLPVLLRTAAVLVH